MINPSAPAYPVAETKETESLELGLSIRAELSARFMQAIISANSARIESGRGLEREESEYIAKEAIMCADALIKQLNQ